MFEVTAYALSMLLHEAYESNSEDLSLEAWVLKSMTTYPTFQFWLNILNLIVLLLKFVSSVRTGDFNLYKQTIHLMCPWYFALNHQNYARWLPIHLRDMEELQEKAPGVHQSFCEGK